MTKSNPLLDMEKLCETFYLLWLLPIVSGNFPVSENHGFGTWLEMKDLLIIITWHTIIFMSHKNDGGEVIERRKGNRESLKVCLK